MLVLKNVTKKFNNIKAVNNLNLNVEEGIIYGFVGPNGSGKTTTMKIASGLLYPDVGEIYVNGIKLKENSSDIANYIGYMPDFFGVYDNLKVIEYMEFYYNLYLLDKAKMQNKIKNLLILVGMENMKEQYVNTLSRGMKQKLCLARSLVHDPKILILDEPASGLDPKARIEMKNILLELNNMGKTILISSHILPEISEISNYIGVIEKGKIIFSGNVNETINKFYKYKRVKLEVINDTDKAIKVLNTIKNINNIDIKGNTINFEIDGDKEILNYIIVKLIESEVKVVEFSEIKGRLEDIFIKLTEGDNDEN